ncbi:MAG: N-acyl-D-amino-acid deacylase family protein [Chitinophagaceae bacterium]
MRKLLISSLFVCFVCLVTTAQTADLLIQNARILDGTGNSWFWGSIDIVNGKIAHVYRNKIQEVQAKRIIDAKGMLVTPGFIDVHGHIEGGIFERPTADNYIRDGVTSVVTGNCGGSADDIAEFLNRIDSIKTSINVATLVGHNTVRRLAMGNGDRQASPEEMKKMEELMAKGMKEGAVGMSTGLIYLPGMYANTQEIVNLARVANAYGGVYATHMRNEGLNVTDAIEEALTIGRESGIPVQISHFKVAGNANWGRSIETLNMVKQAREQGYDVTIDQYPYTASSTNLATQVPDWALAGGLDSLRERIKNKNTREQIKMEMRKSKQNGKIKSYSYAVVASYASDTSYNGKNISDINKLNGRKANLKNEAETILEMLEKSNAQMVYHSMNENDVKYFMQYPFNMPAADAGVSNGKGMPHPRGYGTNSRVLARYVREFKIISVEEAVRRMTSLPAQKFGLKDRGLIKVGMAADIVIFDENTIQDNATFDAPHQFATGIPYVIVNGEVVVENTIHTGIRSGKSLKNK